MSSTPLQQSGNASYDRLKRDLGQDAGLLAFLPYKRATFAPQTEIPEAAPFRILYGDMVEEKDQLWIYFTLNYNEHKDTRSHYRMITFHTLKGLQTSTPNVRPHLVQKVAIASSPFKHASDQFTLAAIAKYFFIRKGIDYQLKFPLSVQPWKGDLLRVCNEYKALYEKTKDIAKENRRSVDSAAGSYDMVPSQFQSQAMDPPSQVPQQTPTRASSRAASRISSQAHQRAPSRAPSEVPSRAPSPSPPRVLSEVSSRVQSRTLSHVNDRKHSRSPTDEVQEHYEHDARGVPSYPQLSIQEVSNAPNSAPFNPPDPRVPSKRPSTGPTPGDSIFSERLSDDHPSTEPTLRECLVDKNRSVKRPFSFYGRFSSTERDNLMDNYIALRTREEDLNSKIGKVDKERASLAKQLAEVQADLNVVDDRKLGLEEEKEHMMAEKKKLQDMLEDDECLDFGFEAGRRMESKKLRTS